jgi:hypothetical protein
MFNLFPTYATNAQLGTNGYQEYLDKFVEIVDPDFLSHDNYPLKAGGSYTYGYYWNLEMTRAKAIESGIDPMAILALTKFGAGESAISYDELEWEINICLAYGMKRISYFTYWMDQLLEELGWEEPCVDYNGNIYQHYYDVQNVSKWLLPLGTELFNKNSTAVFHIKSSATQPLETECVGYTSYGDLGEVDAKNFVVGFFDDGSFMISNKAYQVVSTFTYENGAWIEHPGSPDSRFVFLDIDSGLEYFDTETATWRDAEADGVVFRNEDGKLEKIFDLSEGMLFRVVD